jgi:glycosyltransferase involved in cell wall biosynthesis
VTSTAEPLVSACICTHERAPYAAACVEALLRQTARSDAYEIIVVDSASGPDCARVLAGLAARAPNIRVIRTREAGLSVARNEGAKAARGRFVAYVDDDAIPAPDWIASIERAIDEAPSSPALLGGRLLPLWEKELPAWWPARLVGLLSIIAAEGRGAYGSPGLPAGLQPYGANMIVRKDALLAVGGFSRHAGRRGRALLSDEDVELAGKLARDGQLLMFDSRLLVWHRIQANRLKPAWLLSRLYWQGFSTVLTRRSAGRPMGFPELLRRMLVFTVFLPWALVARNSPRGLPLRWRFAYSAGVLRGTLARPAAGR